MERQNNKGIFIAFEGIDGSGKTTQIGILSERLHSMGICLHKTSEPTDSPVGLLIRDILAGRLKAHGKVIAGLFVADRAGHLLDGENAIRKIIDSGTSVITDRYYFSSYAYQGVDLDMDWIINANSINSEILRPSLTVFLDVPVETALERIRQSRENVELFEREERLKKVRENYFAAFEKLKAEEKVAVIDASGEIGEVAERIWQAVSGLFE